MLKMRKTVAMLLVVLLMSFSIGSFQVYATEVPAPGWLLPTEQSTAEIRIEI
jgi:hypothetical protein